MPGYTKMAIALVLAGAVVLGGCENMDRQTQRMLSGGAVGAGYIVNEIEKK